MIMIQFTIIIDKFTNFPNLINEGLKGVINKKLHSLNCLIINSITQLINLFVLYFNFIFYSIIHRFINYCKIKKLKLKQS